MNDELLQWVAETYMIAGEIREFHPALVVVTSGGPKEQGEPVAAICRSPEIAAKMWKWAMLEQFPAGSELVIRRWPAVEECEMYDAAWPSDRRRHYLVTCRVMQK